MFQRKTILFLSLHKQDYTFFHVFTFLQYISSAISIIIPVSVSVEALSLSPFQPVNSSSVGGSKEEGRGVSAVLSSVVLLLPQAFPRKKRPKKGGKSLSELRKGFSFPILFSAKPIAASATRISTLEREREREMMGKGGPGGSIGGGSKEGGGMERKLLFSISARAEERGPEAKKGLIPESWGPFKKALFLLQRWEGAGSVCRWESAPPRLNSHLSFLSFLLSLFLVI